MITADISSVHVLEFCRGISDAALFYVSVEPRPGLENGNCFNNVDVVVARHGGASVYGWNILEWPGVFIEAEQHAVWRLDDGSFLDPTPPVRPFSRIAFLFDPTLGEWEIRPNVKRALVADRLIDDWLETARLVQRQQQRKQILPAPLARQVRALDRRLRGRYGTEPWPDQSPSVSSLPTSRTAPGFPNASSHAQGGLRK